MIHNRRSRTRHSGLRKPTGLINRFEQVFIDPLTQIFKRALRAYNRNKRKEDKDGQM